MIPYGLFSQLATIALSIAVIFTYVKPAFTEISQTQDKIAIYEGEQAKVSEVNNTLAELVAAMDALPTDDERRLRTYLPDSVDTIAVPRDLNSIANQAGVLVSDISYKGQDEFVTDQIDPMTGLPIPANPTGAPVSHTFTIGFEGSYSQIKEVVKMLEENDYPLEIHELSITKSEGGLLVVDMEIVTYSLYEPEPIVPIDVTIVQ